MFAKGSRYEKARRLTASSGSSSAFSGVRPRDIAGAEGVVEHVVSAGDRFDLLAKYYYNDDRLWWRIMDANPQLLSRRRLGREGDEPEDDIVLGVDLSEFEGMVILVPRAGRTS